MSRTEVITAKFKGAVTDAKRTVLIFENPKNPKFDLRYATFPPHIPVLEPGKTYEFKVEHVPTGKSDGSEYHNLFREDKTSKYEIAEVAGTEAVTPPPSVPAPVLNFEQEKQKQIRREACVNSAIALLTAAFPAKNPPTIKDVLKAAEEIEEWVKG